MLTTQEAADYLGLARGTLEIWRTRGGGPTFVKIGRAVRYRKEDLEDFILKRTYSSTSSYDTQEAAA